MTDRFEEAVREAARDLGHTNPAPGYEHAWKRGRRRRVQKQAGLAFAGLFVVIVALGVNFGSFGSKSTEVDELVLEAGPATAAAATAAPTPAESAAETDPVPLPTDSTPDPVPVPSVGASTTVAPQPTTPAVEASPTVVPATTPPAGQVPPTPADPTPTAEPATPAPTAVPTTEAEAVPLPTTAPEASLAEPTPTPDIASATGPADTSEPTVTADPSTLDPAATPEPTVTPDPASTGPAPSELPENPIVTSPQVTSDADATLTEPASDLGSACDLDGDGIPEATCYLLPAVPCVDPSEAPPGYEALDTDGDGVVDLCAATNMTICDTNNDGLADTPCIIEIE